MNDLNRPNHPTTPLPLQLKLTSIKKTLEIGKFLGQRAQGGDCFAVTGDLGAGKTMLARGVAFGLGTPQDLVSSPTFTLIHEYPGPIPMVHVDLYRLNSESELTTLGLQEYFGGTQVIFVEWADRFPQVLPEDHVKIHMVHRGEHSRTAILQGTGPNSLQMIDQLSQALQDL